MWNIAGSKNAVRLVILSWFSFNFVVVSFVSPYTQDLAFAAFCRLTRSLVTVATTQSINCAWACEDRFERHLSVACQTKILKREVRLLTLAGHKSQPWGVNLALVIIIAIPSVCSCCHKGNFGDPRLRRYCFEFFFSWYTPPANIVLNNLLITFFGTLLPCALGLAKISMNN